MIANASACKVSLKTMLGEASNYRPRLFFLDTNWLHRTFSASCLAGRANEYFSRARLARVDTMASTFMLVPVSLFGRPHVTSQWRRCLLARLAVASPVSFYKRNEY